MKKTLTSKILLGLAYFGSFCLAFGSLLLLVGGSLAIYSTIIYGLWLVLQAAINGDIVAWGIGVCYIALAGLILFSVHCIQSILEEIGWARKKKKKRRF